MGINIHCFAECCKSLPSILDYGGHLYFVLDWLCMVLNMSSAGDTYIYPKHSCIDGYPYVPTAENHPEQCEKDDNE
jgi:hypothetical protein